MRVLGLVIIVSLCLTVLVGTAIGGRYRVAPPVLLIALGAIIGLVPASRRIGLQPDVVLLLFLPAILYWESINTSLREVRANLRIIVLSSVVLVVVTMVTVSYAAQALGVDPRAAWVLGAVLAPTDAAAVSGLAKEMPRRTLTTLRTESLINDGTALVLFAVAVSAARDGHVTAWTVPLEVVGSYVGGLAAGLAVSGVIVMLERRIDDPLLEGGLSVLTPFVAFLLAEEIHVSGVVAVVVAGLVMARTGPRLVRARSRVQTFNWWDLSTFLLNGSLFVLVGIQVPHVLRGLGATSAAHAIGVSLAVTAAAVGTRLIWVHASALVIRTVDRRPIQRTRRVSWRVRTASGWAGFRGAVSLAAALAVPTTLRSGVPFPDRDLLVFTTVVVIVLTVLVQGTTLPMVMRWARLPEDSTRAEEVRLAQRTAVDAALTALPSAAAAQGVDGAILSRLRSEYEEHARAVALEVDSEDGRSSAAESAIMRRIRLEVLDAKRAAVTQLRDTNQIDDIVLREVQAGMDLEEVRLLGPVPTD
jgi:Na+/H+ antiporter